MSQGASQLKDRLVDVVFGSADEACKVPSQPVRFGRKHWLAQHRWLEPAIGVVALLGVGVIYGLSFEVVTAALAWTMLALWGAILTGAVMLWIRRPCTVLRLPAHAIVVWIAGIAIAAAAGLGK
jgi:hypothetical protein